MGTELIAIAVTVLFTIATSLLVGRYMFKVFTGERTLLDRDRRAVQGGTRRGCSTDGGVDSYASPPVTLRQFVSMPRCIGDRLFTVLPLPNCPNALAPQVTIVPFALIPPEFADPAAMAFQSAAEPILVGTFLFTFVPSPSCPLELRPQVQSSPKFLIAMV